MAHRSLKLCQVIFLTRGSSIRPPDARSTRNHLELGEAVVITLGFLFSGLNPNNVSSFAYRRVHRQGLANCKYRQRASQCLNGQRRSERKENQPKVACRGVEQTYCGRCQSCPQIGQVSCGFRVCSLAALAGSRFEGFAEWRAAPLRTLLRARRVPDCL